jgi:hypothetical protein
LKTPQFGQDSAAVWKEAPAFIAPIMALILSFLFGGQRLDGSQIVPNPISFYVAIAVSLTYASVLFIALFCWQDPMIENIHKASLPLNYFSALTIAALNFFFVGASQTSKPDPSAGH